ncbi:MAG: hypothetical protein EP323_00270 [Gammaproteobacteria bacterium]|nr:MAG: hypothetical protein EP323_00270 [Gammaproteobacteria bacterium]
MDSIWKFELEVIDEQLIKMPAGSLTLDVQVQNGKPCLWARVNPKIEKVKRRIITHGTGHQVPETTGDYIGSYQLQGGALVFHVFEAA